MNRQEVNLYAIEFHRSDQLLSVKQILQLTAAAAVVLLLFYGFSFWRLSLKQELIDTAVEDHQIIEQRLSALKSSRPKSKRSELENDVEDLKSDLSYREQLANIMSGPSFGNSEGFSNQMEGLARHTVSDLSLTNIRLLNGGSYLELDGWVSKPAAVPTYLQNLRQESSFQNVKFGVISIRGEKELPPKNRNLDMLKFSLGKADGKSS